MYMYCELYIKTTNSTIMDALSIPDVSMCLLSVCYVLILNWTGDNKISYIILSYLIFSYHLRKSDCRVH